MRVRASMMPQAASDGVAEDFDPLANPGFGSTAGLAHMHTIAHMTAPKGQPGRGKRAVTRQGLQGHKCCESLQTQRLSQLQEECDGSLSFADGSSNLGSLVELL